jgi:hypothetical protein
MLIVGTFQVSSKLTAKREDPRRRNPTFEKDCVQERPTIVLDAMRRMLKVSFVLSMNKAKRSGDGQRPEF